MTSATEQPCCKHTGEPLSVVSHLSEEFAISREGVVYNLRAESLNYNHDYFLKEYAAQYGRDYLADEKQLRQLARRRLAYLNTLSRHDAGASPALFEIGCATGFFLDEARNKGYHSAGIEVSKFGADYARRELKLDVEQGSFLELDVTTRYDVVAAFYVIEHLSEQRLLFEKISSLLKPGGIFLFALPSTYGPTYQTDPERWCKTHPHDHYVDYSPAALRRILPRYGLEVKAVWPASYHPERVRGLSPWRLAGPFYSFFADRFAYGDTLEGLAIKE